VIAMMPWQMAQDLIRVREAELSRRARAAAARQAPERDHDDAAPTTVVDVPNAKTRALRLRPLGRLARR
jgi:hypothetical protein